mgnify:CR=1 FL=1
MGGHGTETFVQGIQNSCNPVFMEIGLRLGADRFYDYFSQFGLLGMTNVDLPGEAGTIMHKREDIGTVELATMTFGQSFQITPIQMLTTVSSMINGGRRVTPHFGMEVLNGDGEVLERLSWEEKSGIVSEETSATMRGLFGECRGRGVGKQRLYRGVSDRRKDGDIPDVAEKCEQIYRIVYRICAGRESAGDRDGCDP